MHRLGEIHPLDRLGQERICRPILIHLVRFAPRSAVETHTLRRAGVQQMKVAVGLRYLFRHVAVDRRDALQGVEGTSQLLDRSLDRRALASDHRLVRRVYDEQINPVERLDDLTCPIGGRLDHAHAPIHVGVIRDAPGFTRGVTASRQIADEQLALRHAS